MWKWMDWIKIDSRLNSFIIFNVSMYCRQWQAKQKLLFAHSIACDWNHLPSLAFSLIYCRKPPKDAFGPCQRNYHNWRHHCRHWLVMLVWVKTINKWQILFDHILWGNIQSRKMHKEMQGKNRDRQILKTSSCIILGLNTAFTPIYIFAPFS